MQCTLKRCQGKRGCICPKGAVPVGTYAGRKTDSPLAESKEKMPAIPSLLPTNSSPTKTPAASSLNASNSTPKKLPSIYTKGSTAPTPVVKAPAPKETVPLVAAGASVEEDLSYMNGVDGEVMIRYNHYKKKFAIVKGSTNTAAVDAEYYLSFAFPKSKIHLTLYGPSDFSFEEQGLPSRPLVMEKPAGTYWGLDPAKEYWVDIEEDSEERRAYEERQDALAKESAAKRADKDAAGEDGCPLIKTKTESCSCIEGNPCLDRYACKDWEHRYDVAKRNGWKGFQ